MASRTSQSILGRVLQKNCWIEKKECLEMESS